MEFDFDLAADTAYSVASEMVSDLSLSHDDATVRLLCPQCFCSRHPSAIGLLPEALSCIIADLLASLMRWS